MTAHRTLLLPFLTLTLAASAQESKVRWKVETNFDLPPVEGKVFNKVVRGDAGCIVALRVNGTDPIIGGRNQNELDRTLVSYTTEKSIQEIKFDKTKIIWGEEGQVAIETIERFAGMFRVIGSKPDKEHGKMLVIHQAQSPRSLTGKGGQLLAEVPFDMLGGNASAFQMNTAVGFTTTVGVDSTKMLIGLSPESTIRSAGCPVFAMMFDKQLKRLWWNKLSTSGTIDIISTEVDPKGAAWYLIKNITNPGSEGATEATLGYSFTLYKLDSMGQQSVLLDLPGGEFAKEAHMDMRPDGSIIVAGVYGDENTNRSESVGVFNCLLDAKDPKALKFDRFKLLPYQKRMEKKEERWQEQMVIDRVLAKKNGGAYIVTRKSGLETHYVADLSGAKHPKTEQVEGSLHVFEVDASGDQKWYRVWDRTMTYDNAVPGTVIPMVFDDVLFILLNDNEMNNEKRKQKMPVDAVNLMKDALLIEFKPDGGDKAKLVLRENQYRQLGLQAQQWWQCAPGLWVTMGAEGFGRDKAWPVVVNMNNEVKK